MNWDRSVITLDIDWAADWIIDRIAEQLVSRRVKATWFATHRSPGIERLLAERDLFEVGIHPNFLAGSTHGDTEEEVIRTVLGWFPEAGSCRMHSLHHSERLLQTLTEQHELSADCSIYLRSWDHIRPFSVRYSEGGRELVRIPHFFQDNMDMNHPITWQLDDSAFQREGLKVFNFHPIHLALNSANIRPYEAVRSKYPLNTVTEEQLAAYRKPGPGASSLFTDLLGALQGGETWTIAEIAEEYRESN